MVPRRSHTSLVGLEHDEIAGLVEQAGEPAYRAQQILDAVYHERVESAEQISTLPQQFRQDLLGQGVSVRWPGMEKKFVSEDGTVRYLIAFADGQSVEPLWMPARYGREAGAGS